MPTSDAADAWTGDLERLGARVVEAAVPEPAANTWPLFIHEAARSHAATFPSRADEYGDNCRTKLELRAARRPAEAVDGRLPRARASGARYEPEVDLYVAPCVAIDLPPEDCDELEVRLPFSAFLRWVNLIGWAGAGDRQPAAVAPHDETVLAAGLAWERG